VSLAATLLVVSTVGAAEVTGRLRSVSREKNLLVLADAARREWTIHFTPQTRVTTPGPPIPIEALRPGRLVRVVYRENKGQLEALEIVPALRGDITGLAPRPVPGFELLSAEKKYAVLVDPEAKVFVKGKEGSFADLKPGQGAEVVVEKKGKMLVAKSVTASPLPVTPTPEAAAPVTPPVSPVADDRFTLVRILYATDRKPLLERPGLLARLWGPLLLLGGAGGLALLRLLGPVWRRWIPAFVLTAAFGAAVAWAVLRTFPLPAVADPGVVYGGERGTLHYGHCDVSIPRAHKMGHLETPSILKLEFKEDPAKHVVLQKVEVRSADEFFEECRAQLGKSVKKEAMVFVHGFNISFEEGARRTAQLAHDLTLDGPAVLYSWPSQGSLVDYTVDEATAEWAWPHLQTFLKDFAARSGAASVHLIAHSMGNRILASALKGLAAEKGKEAALFKEVVLTAPDVDADVFREQLYPAIRPMAGRITLYASSRDRALQLSRQIHGAARAGDTGGGILVLPPMDTVDASAVDTDLIGHSYYGDNNSVVTDLFYLLHEHLPPERRSRLKAQRLGPGRQYWVFVP
jgi:esterase/lipase superfamily enzyme